MIKIWRGGRVSESARQLSVACNGRINRPLDSRMRGRRGDVLVDWGTRALAPVAEVCTVLNTCEASAIAVNKLAFYQSLYTKGFHEIIPRFGTDIHFAIEGIANGHDIMARRTLTGSQGAGISLHGPNFTSSVIPQDCPLYVEYVKKTQEYRVHVGKTGPHRYECFDQAYKRKRREVANEDVNYQVRNSANGWVYCRDGTDVGVVPDCVKSAARDAVAACELDFGAVDVGHHAPSGRVCVYEVNTAPGLEGTTLERYTDYIRSRA